jgi:hypothetical protein
MISLALAGSVASPAVAAHSLDELEAMLRERESPVQIVHEPARHLGLSHYRGKVVVLYLVEGECKDDCAVLKRKLSDIQREVSRTPMADRVDFVAAKRPKAAPPLTDRGAVTYLIDKSGNLRARYHGEVQPHEHDPSP